MNNTQQEPLTLIWYKGVYYNRQRKLANAEVRLYDLLTGKLIGVLSQAEPAVYSNGADLLGPPSADL